jgi:peptidoglycan/LPS O-acetylase OafA/YrhL
MLRSVIAVAAGYISMLLLIMLLFLIIGIIFPEAFPQPDAFPSIPWVVCILFFGLAASIIGGGVTVTVCRGSRIKHIHALAIVVLFIGLVTLAASIEKQPLWYLLAQVVVGLVGVYVGGHLANKRFPQEPVRVEA